MNPAIIKSCVLSSFLAATALLIPVSYAETDPWPAISPAGLHRATFSRLSVVYLAPNVDLGIYNEIMLMEPVVRFRKNREGTEISEGHGLDASPEVILAVRKKMASEFRKVFAEKLENGGYDIVQKEAFDVLLVRPAIINLEVSFPEDAESSDVEAIVRSAGELTLFLEAFDSVTGEVLARGMDLKETTDMGGDGAGLVFFRSDLEPEKDQALIDYAFNDWADSLVKSLNEARAHR